MNDIATTHSELSVSDDYKVGIGSNSFVRSTSYYCCGRLKIRLDI
jgi:hypothetical protein